MKDIEKEEIRRIIERFLQSCKQAGVLDAMVEGIVKDGNFVGYFFNEGSIKIEFNEFSPILIDAVTEVEFNETGKF